LFDADEHAMQQPFNLAAWARERLVQYREKRERGIIANLVDQAEREHRAQGPAPVHMEDVFAAQLTYADVRYLRKCRISLRG
jgi:hypothetical protein